jgi:hypothetical protein
MRMLTRIAPLLAIAALLPAGSALALEVKPTGAIFSEYSVDLKKTLGTPAVFSHTFSLSRTRAGVWAKEGPVWGKVVFDASSDPVGRLNAYLKYATAEVDLGFMRMQGGQFDTAWTIPVEGSWFPFRYATGEFTNREGLFPGTDRGLAWSGDMGPVGWNLGYFNGEGDQAAETTNNNKAYEVTCRIAPMSGAEIALHGRYGDAVGGGTATALAGLNLKAGPAIVGAQGGMNMQKFGSAAQTSGFGGSGHVYLPDLVPVPMLETPVVRADYASDKFSPTNPTSHYRVIAGFDHEWAKGAHTMITFEFEQDLTTNTQTSQTLAWKGGWSF